MADNELTVLDASGTTRGLRSVDVGAGKQAQATVVWEGPEVPAIVTGATSLYTVVGATPVPLDPPDAGARFGRLRVYETTGPGNPDLRLFYRQDGVTLSGSSNATGFLLHGEMIIVKLADFTKFRMVAEGAASFQVFVEWLGNA